MEFEELKEKFAGEVVDDEGYDEINETENVVIQDNGMSGKDTRLHYWTAQEVVGENEVVNEFDFYTE